jgi:uncharacterized glyoxalase superfamily protein PhnB
MKKLTPVLFVEAIEPSLAFWVDRLGFAKTVEVPHEGRLGFAILERDGIEVMLQSWASVAADIPKLASAPRGHSCGMYIEVEDLAAITQKLEGVEIVVPKRETFYGATEVFVREPGGHVVGFAQHG